MKNRGFTLFELIITMGIIGILATIGGLSVKRQMRTNALLKIDSDVGEFFRTATENSLLNGKKQTLNFLLNSNKITTRWVTEDSESGSYVLPNYFDYAITITSDDPLITTDSSVGITGKGNLGGSIKFFVLDGDNGVRMFLLDNGDEHVQFAHLKIYEGVGTPDVVNNEDDRSVTSPKWKKIN